MHKAYGRLFGLLIPASAVVVLTALLVFAMFRLSQIQRDMRTNVSANMLWVITQTQIKALHLTSALYQHWYVGGHVNEVLHEYKLLRSRLNLLEAGPQARYLRALDQSEPLMDSVQKVNRIGDVVRQALSSETQAFTHVLSVLTELDAHLNAMANKTMVAQWEEMGGRLDHYRNGVLFIIFLMLGICACCLVISVYMIMALKRARETEWVKRRAIQLEAQLDAERQLGELHRSFAAMVSHQFRTPLAIIDASMQRLLRTSDVIDRQQLMRRVHKVRRATKRLTLLVEHTLIADQHDEGFDVHLQRCALWPLLVRIVDEQRENHPALGVQVVAPDGLLPDIMCDPGLVDHIVSNFISNAVKYSTPNTLIRVTFFHDDHYAGCSVHNEGVGVDQDDLPHLFDKYYRSARMANIQGTGIGLYVARKLAILQGGDVQASSIGSETIFSVHFRVAEAVLKEGADDAHGG